MQRRAAWILITLAGGAGGCEAAASPAASAAPVQRSADAEPSSVLVELFTSQGCSSCPPADALLRELAVDPDLDIVPLAFHVDYWNYIGWEDPFSDARWSARQRAYAQARDSDRVYTPQLLFDGRDHAVGTSARRSRTAIAEQSRPGGATVDVRAQVRGPHVDVELQLEGEIRSRDAAVFVAVVRDGATTKVRSGENARRTLDNAFIVLEMAHGCDYDPGAECTARLSAPHESAHVVAWVQSTTSMEVFGTGLTYLGD